MMEEEQVARKLEARLASQTEFASGGRPVRALILDDDEWALRLLRALLEEAFPGLELECRTQPDPSGDFDLYFVDNDFDGSRCAGELARSIRERQPDALIVAFSATLDRPTLKSLLNAGCNGACDKNHPNELEDLILVTRGYLEARARARALPEEQRGVIGAIRSIRDLLREWNSRLGSEEASLAE